MIKHLFQDIFYTKFRTLFLLGGRTECSDYGFYIDTAFSLTPMKYAHGETICKQGDKFSEVYLVQEGEIEASFTLDDVKVRRFFQSGFFFGAINILSNKICRVDYKASKNVKLLVWDVSKFLEIINRYSEMKQHIISVSFQLFKTSKKAMIQAMIQTIKEHKGITLNEESGNRIFRNMVKFIHEQKSKQYFLSQDVVTPKNAVQDQSEQDHLAKVKEKLIRVQNYAEQLDPVAIQTKQMNQLSRANQHKQMQSLIRDLDRQERDKADITIEI